MVTIFRHSMIQPCQWSMFYTLNIIMLSTAFFRKRCMDRGVGRYMSSIPDIYIVQKGFYMYIYEALSVALSNLVIEKEWISRWEWQKEGCYREDGGWCVLYMHLYNVHIPLSSLYTESRASKQTFQSRFFPTWLIDIPT